MTPPHHRPTAGPRFRAPLKDVCAWTACTLVLLATACAPDDGERDQRPDDTANVSAAPSPYGSDEPDTIFSAQLSGTQGQQGVEGRLSLVGEGDDPIELHVRGSGLPPGEHAWHIHEGACGSSGPVRIALSETADMGGITGALEVDRDGAFEESVEVPELTPDLAGRGGHSLHVHQRGGTDHGPTIACATI